mmetsp:Transcript_39193/g.92124  ORF Transcript_39193/g.92124 Transcript_39193/m.92124 type:complete len:276 (+) Transcript_39193:849-1676(+)
MPSTLASQSIEPVKTTTGLPSAGACHEKKSRSTPVGMARAVVRPPAAKFFASRSDTATTRVNVASASRSKRRILAACDRHSQRSGALAAVLAWRSKISASTLCVKQTVAPFSCAGRSTAAWTKSKTTTSKVSAASSFSTAARAAGVRSAATLMGSDDSKSGTRCQRGRGGLGCQPTKRSHCRFSSPCHLRCCSAVAGDSSVMSNRPLSFSPRRMLPVRILPPASAGNRKTGEMKATLRRRRAWLTSRCPRIAQSRRRAGRHSRSGQRRGHPGQAR